MSSGLLSRLKSQFPDAVLDTSTFRGDDAAIVTPAAWYPVAEFLRDDAFCDMSMFVDITAVDYPKREARFDLVLHLHSLQRGHRLRLKTQLFEEESDGPVPGRPSRVRSVTSLWLAANWFEREVWDMFGIRFDGHPDLRRILMYEEFEGHALRKDYPAQKTQPLVPYRERADVPLEKLAPFGPDEGMPWGRRDWQPRDNAWDDSDQGAMTTDPSAASPDVPRRAP